MYPPDREAFLVYRVFVIRLGCCHCNQDIANTCVLLYSLLALSVGPHVKDTIQSNVTLRKTKKRDC